MNQMKQQTEIGNWIRQIREQLEESQAVFGERFDCSRDDVANYERGLCDIPDKLLAALDRLGYNLSWLLNNDGAMIRD